MRFLLPALFLLAAGSLRAEFRAGAASLDITPRELPVIQNGGFLSATVKIIADRLHARALVMDDGSGPVVICVVDSCMIPTPLCDAAKKMAAAKTGIDPARILICATHTHNAPSVMDFCLGTDRDKTYTEFLPPKIAEVIIAAHSAMRPAEVAWLRFDAANYTATRRYITRPDRMGPDPFGGRTVQANMHPGYQNPNYVGESGPEDPWFTLLSLRGTDGKPLALLGNFSMHYFSGHSGVSADYFGRFCKEMEAKLGSGVTMLSQGTSGDLWRADYAKPKKESEISIQRYVAELADLAKSALDEAEYGREVPVRMAEKRLDLARRAPDEKRLAWARAVLAKMPEGPPRNRPEVYARQAVHLHENPRAEVVLQALRIGKLGITAMPNEVYALTGLHLKARSPLPLTMNIELANGAQGYIPPPEQHHLGGYTTWPATTAGLEVPAEPRIVETLLEMLEEVSGNKRHPYEEARGGYAEAVARLKPAQHWRLGDLAASAGFEPGVVFHLPGVEGAGFPDGHRSRAAMFAGGRLRHEAPLGADYSVAFWFWNGLANNARAVTGYLFSRGVDGAEDAPGEHIGIGGTHRASNTGKLIAFNGNESDQLLEGKTVLGTRRWYHCAIVRRGNRIEVYLDGKPDLAGDLPVTHGGSKQIFLGGRNDNFANLQGRLDEAALWDRPLSAAEVAALHETGGVAEAAPWGDEPPLDPEESLAKAHVPDGFKVELVAAEPLVMDPVAVDWAADGSVWVAEMADYPSAENGKRGRLVRLLDENGDHLPDRRTVLIDGIAFPTGVLAWGKGVIASAAGEIFYAEDTNGDGAADVRDTWFRGFIEGNQQLRVNGLRWGLDGWIYCASGGHHAGFGTKTVIECVATGKKVKLGSRDFRFRPDGSLQPIAGPSQFGRVCDNEGNWFGVQNAHPLWHYALDDRYFSRNPDVPAPDPRVQLRGQQPRVFAASKQQKRFHGFDHVGRYTSACGISIYRDELLFAAEPGKTIAFTCEPFSNLVQRHVLTDAGASYTAERAPDGEREFFASGDRWCRPVMSRTAPDGSLWVVDFYRYMIEHPDWLPPEGKEELRPNYQSGQGMGRIYRVSKTGAKHEWRKPSIDSPNGIARDIALRESFRGDGPPSWDAVRVSRALKHTDPGTRRLGLRMAEGLGKMPASVAEAASDPDPKVRLQAAFTLGEFEDAGAGEALRAVATRDGSDPYFAAAVLSSAVPHYSALVADAAAMPEPVLAGLLKMSGRFPDAAAKLAGNLLARGGDATKWRALANAPAAVQDRARAQAREVVADRTRAIAERVAAMRLLNADDAARLTALSDGTQPTEIQLAGIAALGRIGAGDHLLVSWRRFAPTARDAAERALLAKESSARALLESVKTGRIAPIELSASAREQLLGHKKLGALAKEAFGSLAGGDRAEVIARYRPALAAAGDASKGSTQFAARCATCHKLGDVGRAVGPDLKAISDRSPAALLTAIIDPSRSVEPRYLGYTAKLQGGESVFGLIAAETANSVVMHLLDGSEQILKRAELTGIEGSGKSAMPAGLEAGMKIADMADLLAFLNSELAK